MSRILEKKRMALMVASALGVVVLLLTAVGSPAATYPSRAITMIVAYAPGGGSDVSARLIAPYAAKKFGVPVNVVNVVGASGITGTMQTLNATPDGYTIMIDNTSNASFLVASRTDLPFKLEDKRWMGQWIADPMFYMFNAATPFKTLKEAMAFAKANPEKYSWGAGAQASQSMFHGLSLLSDAGVDIAKTKMVVFPEGAAPSMQAMFAGTVMEAGGLATDVDKFLPTGRIKVLAVADKRRFKKYPDIPTTVELGYPNATLVAWYGFSGPKKLPQEVVDVWAKLQTEASKDPEFLAAADKMSKTLSFMGPKEQEAYVMKEYADMVKLSQKVGLRK